MALTPSGSITVSANNQTIQNLEITGRIICNGFSNLTVRNCWIKFPSGSGLLVHNVTGGGGLTVEDCKFNNTVHATGQNPNPSVAVCIDLNNIPGPTNITRCTFYDAVGLKAYECTGFITAKFIEGHNIRGQNFLAGGEAGHFMNFAFNSGGFLVEDFSCINDPYDSRVEDIISVYANSGSIIFRRGLLDGSASPIGSTMMFETITGALVEDVDGIRHFNAGFGVYSNNQAGGASVNHIYRRCRLRDQLLGNPGLGFPASDPDDGLQPTSFISSPGTINTRFEQCKYWNVSPELIWDISTVSLFDVTQQNFTARAPIVNVFPWESGFAFTAIGRTTASPQIGPATLGGVGFYSFTAIDLSPARPFIGPAPSGIGGVVNLVASGGVGPGADTLDDAPVFTGTLGASQPPTGWTWTGTDPACNTLINPGSVNGTATYAVQLRETASLGYQGFEHSFTWSAGQKYTISASIRIPTGVTAPDCAIYFGSIAITFVTDAILNAQAKDTWIVSSIDYTATGSEGSIVSFIAGQNELVGQGYDLALPEIKPWTGGGGGAIATASPSIGSPAITVKQAVILLALPVKSPGPNILADAPVFTGTLGNEQFPTGWEHTGIYPASTVLFNPGTVNGISTFAIRLRQVIPPGGVPTYVGFEHTFAWAGVGEKYKISAWFRIPFAVTASDCKLYMGGTPLGSFVAASTLNAQPRDTWVFQTVDYIVVGGESAYGAVGFINPAEPVGTGFDFALPTIQQYVASGGAIGTQSPFIGTPASTTTTYGLVASPLAPNTVVLGFAVLKQRQTLVPTSSLAIGSPSLGTPALSTPISGVRDLFASSFAPTSSIIIGSSLLQVDVEFMPLVLGDGILDFGLNSFALANKIVMCSQRPTSYADVDAVKIGEKDLGVGNVVASGPIAATPNGRKITTAVVTGGVVTTNGTPTCWAVVDDVNSQLLASGPITGGVSITTSQTFSLQAFTITMRSIPI